MRVKPTQLMSIFGASAKKHVYAYTVIPTMDPPNGICKYPDSISHGLQVHTGVTTQFVSMLGGERWSTLASSQFRTYHGSI